MMKELILNGIITGSIYILTTIGFYQLLGGRIKDLRMFNQLGINGIIAGSIYALIAIGFTVI